MLKKTTSVLYPITPNSPLDSSIIKFYAPYKAAIDSQMNTVVAIVKNDIARKRPEGLLNNLYADAMCFAAQERGIQFDFVHNNYHSLRTPLYKGELKVFRVFELMPFENLLVTVNFTGAQVQELFDYMASQGGDPIAGASFKIENGKAKSITIGGKPFDATINYTVLTSDYMANGGDGADIYLKSVDRKEFPIKVRDALLEYLRKQSQNGKMIAPVLDGRIVADKEYPNE